MDIVLSPFPCIIDYARSFKGGGCLFPCEVRPMGTWNNLQEGFTVNERLPDTLVAVAVCNVYFSVANIHRQKEQIKKPPCVTLARLQGDSTIIF